MKVPSGFSKLLKLLLIILTWCQTSSVVKNLPANAGDLGDVGWIPGLGRSPGGRNGNPFQYSCLENPMDWGAWWATVHGVTKSQTRLSSSVHTCTDVKKSCTNSATNPYIHICIRFTNCITLLKITPALFFLSLSFFSEPFESKLQILRSLTPTYYIWCLLPKPRDILLPHFSKRIKINIDTVSLWNW